MHAASSLEAPEEVVAWREALEAPPPDAACGEQFIPIEPLSDAAMPRDTIEEVVQRRGSSRRFTGGSIRFTELSTILDRATHGIPADFPAMNDIYLIVNSVEGLRQGSYFFHPGQGRLEVLSLGDFRARAAFLALEQQLAGDAAAAVFFLADLRRWLGQLGNRGYRAAQLEAGVSGGRSVLASYALCL